MKKIFFAAACCFFLASHASAQISDYLDAGNIRSLVATAGHLWWDTASGEARCEYPKGSGKHVGFAAGLWVGGYDAQGQLKVAANPYRQNGNDYWQGPIGANGTSSTAAQAAWNKVWRVTRAQMDSFFIAINQSTPANIPDAILRWPARGNVNAIGANGSILQELTNGATSSFDYAPFVDVDANGTYSALSGDYPRMHGDEMIWQMYNDAGGNKTSSNTQALNFQIGLLAWAYNRGTIADNIQFYEYLLTNRGGQIDSTVVCVFADLDLGFSTDDYIGFDSTHRLGYNYNATATDGSGQAGAYGTQIPVAGVTLLRTEGDAPLSGLRVPAGAFTYFNNTGSGFPAEITDPTSGVEFYRYMTGSNKSGNPFQRDFTGLSGVPTKGYGNGPLTRYVFDGVPSTSGTWSECFSANTPGDRRFLLSSIPFTLPAGEARLVAMALVVSPNAGGCPNTTLTGILQTADTAIKLYDNPPPFFPNSIANPPTNTARLRLFPNPTEDMLFIKVDETSGETRVEVVDVAGRTMNAAAIRTTDGMRISTAHLPAGVYAVRVVGPRGGASGTFVKQ